MNVWDILAFLLIYIGKKCIGRKNFAGHLFYFSTSHAHLFILVALNVTYITNFVKCKPCTFIDVVAKITEIHFKNVTFIFLGLYPFFIVN